MVNCICVSASNPSSEDVGTARPVLQRSSASATRPGPRSRKVAPSSSQAKVASASTGITEDGSSGGPLTTRKKVVAAAAVQSSNNAKKKGSTGPKKRRRSGVVALTCLNRTPW